MTYSFADVTFTVNSPLVGQKQVVGQGIGSIKTSQTDNNTESDIGADGTVMPTKVESARGQIDLEIQQTSSLNKWLTNWKNAHQNGSSSDWCGTTITIIENFGNGLTVSATGVSPMKLPDQTDQQQGQRVTWSFFCTSLTRS